MELLTLNLWIRSFLAKVSSFFYFKLMVTLNKEEKSEGKHHINYSKEFWERNNPTS